MTSAALFARPQPLLGMLIALPPMSHVRLQIGWITSIEKPRPPYSSRMASSVGLPRLVQRGVGSNLLLPPRTHLCPDQHHARFCRITTLQWNGRGKRSTRLLHPLLKTFPLCKEWSF